MAEHVKQSSEFFDEASAVMNAPYWKVPPIEDAAEQVAAVEALIEERLTLSRALQHCRTYDDLHGEARQIYDRARDSLKGGEDDPV